MEKRLNPNLLDQLNSKELFTDLTENSKETRFKLDRLVQKTNLLEARLENATHETREMYTKLSNKISSSGLNNTKIEALVDRHNQIIHAFEVRMAQMQKIIGEQEIQLTNSLAELQLARAEISRLKKL